MKKQNEIGNFTRRREKRKTETRIQNILDLRKKKEHSEIICIREINVNIKNVMGGKALTRPLSVLNRSCEFKRRYDIAFDLKNEKKIKAEVKERMKEYNQRPEVKKRMREYHREYAQRPEVKKRIKEYNQRPDVNKKLKEYGREYRQRPGSKKKLKEYMKEYNQRPEVKKRRRERYLKRKKLKN